MRRPLSVGRHLLGGERRVAVDGGEVIADVAIGVVLQVVRAAGPARRPELHRLVDAPAVPLAGAAVVEAQLVVGIPVGAADPAPEVVADARARGSRGAAGSAASSDWISAASAGVTRSSASSDRIQSCEAQRGGVVLLRAVARATPASRRARCSCRAIAAVSSVLSESTTTISSAQATDASAASRFAASFRVMTVTVSFGTDGSVLRHGRTAAGRRQTASLPLTCSPSALSALRP